MAKRKTGTKANHHPLSNSSRAAFSKFPSILWYLAVIPSLWSFGFTTMWGSDLWWHIATGRWIVTHKALPLTDSWSFTRAGQPWLQHEWLSDLVFQLWVSLFGMNSLVYWKWSILILTFLLLFHVARRLTSDPIASYAAVQAFRPGWEEILEGTGAQYILWPRNEEGKSLAQLVTSDRWRVLFDDFASVLLVRSDQQPPGPMKPTSDSAYRRVTEGIKNLERQRFDEAERDFRGAFALMPDMSLACDSLAQAQAQQGKKKEALQSLEQCQRIFPDRDRANSTRALLK